MEYLSDFMRAQRMELIPEKRIVNTKLTFILNDQMSHFVKRGSQESFLDFLFNNAMDKNGRDLAKVSDFFSRIYNTLEQSSVNIYEFKTFLTLMTLRLDTKKHIANYLSIRSTLLKLSDEDPSPQTNTSLVLLRNSEVDLFLRLFGFERNQLEEFLDGEGLDFDLESISIDVLVYLCLKKSLEDPQFKVSEESADFTRKILIKNKLRRVLVKVKFVSAIMIALRRHQAGKQIDQFTEALNHMKNMLKEDNAESQSQASVEFQSSFFALHSSVSLQRLDLIADGFKAVVEAEIQSFAEFVHERLNDEDQAIEQFKHLLYFLHLKQLSDAIKMSQLIDKLKGGDQISEEQSKLLKLLKKEFFLYGLFKKTAIILFASKLGVDPEQVFKEKFIKNESLDKEIIAFVKRSEVNMNLKLNDLIIKRELEIEQIFSKIKMLPIADEITAILKVHADRINEETRIADLLPQLRSSLRASNLSPLPSKSIFKPKMPDFQEMFDKKEVHLCAKCKSFCNIIEDDDAQTENLTDSQLKEKVLYDDYLQSKAILDYVNTYKSASNVQSAFKLPETYSAFILKKEEAAIERINEQNENRNVGVEKDQSSDIPEPPVLPVRLIKGDKQTEEAPNLNHQVRKYTGMPKAPIIDLDLMSQDENEERMEPPEIQINFSTKQKGKDAPNAPNIKVKLNNGAGELMAPSIEVKVKSGKQELQAPLISHQPNVTPTSAMKAPTINYKANEGKTDLKVPNITPSYRGVNRDEGLQAPVISVPNKSVQSDTRAPVIDIKGLKSNNSPNIQPAPEIQMKSLQNRANQNMNAPIIDTEGLKKNYRDSIQQPPSINVQLKDNRRGSRFNTPTIPSLRSSLRINQEIPDAPFIQAPKANDRQEDLVAPKINVEFRRFSKNNDAIPTPIIDVKMKQLHKNDPYKNLPIIKIPSQAFKKGDLPVPPVILVNLNRGKEQSAIPNNVPDIDLSFLKRNSTTSELATPDIEMTGLNRQKLSVVGNIFAPLAKGARGNITDEFIPVAPLIDFKFKNSAQDVSQSVPDINYGRKMSNPDIIPPNIDITFTNQKGVTKDKPDAPDLQWQSKLYPKDKNELPPLSYQQLAAKYGTEPSSRHGAHKNNNFKMLLEAPVIDFSSKTFKGSNEIPDAPILDEERKKTSNLIQDNSGLEAPIINLKLGQHYHGDQQVPVINAEFKVKKENPLNAPAINLTKKVIPKSNAPLTAPDIQLPRRLTHTQDPDSYANILDPQTNLPKAPVIQIKLNQLNTQADIPNAPRVDYKPKCTTNGDLSDPQIEVKIKTTSIGGVDLEPPRFIVRNSISMKKEQNLVAPSLEVIQTKGFAVNPSHIEMPNLEEEPPARTYSIDYPVQKSKEVEELRKEVKEQTNNQKQGNSQIQSAFRKSKFKKEEASIHIVDDNDDSYYPLDSECFEKNRLSQVESMRASLRMRGSQNLSAVPNLVITDNKSFLKTKKIIEEPVYENYESEVQECDEEKMRFDLLHNDFPRTMSINYPVKKDDDASDEKHQKSNEVAQQPVVTSPVLSPVHVEEIRSFQKRATDFFERNCMNSYINELLSDADHELGIEFPDFDEDEQESYPRTSSVYLPLNYIEKDDEVVIQDAKPRIPKAPRLLLDNMPINIEKKPLQAPKLDLNMNKTINEALVAPYLGGKYTEKKANQDLTPKAPKINLKALAKKGVLPTAPRISLASLALHNNNQSNQLPPAPVINSNMLNKYNPDGGLSAPKVETNLKSQNDLVAPSSLDFKPSSRHSIVAELPPPMFDIKPPKVGFGNEGNTLMRYNTLSNVRGETNVGQTQAQFKYDKSDLPPIRNHEGKGMKIYGELEPPAINVNFSKYTGHQELNAPCPNSFNLSPNKQTILEPPIINYSLSYNLAKQQDRSLKPINIDIKPSASGDNILKVPTIILPNRESSRGLQAPLNILLPVKRYHDDPLLPPDIKLNTSSYKRIELIDPPKLNFSKKNKKGVHFNIIVEEIDAYNNKTVQAYQNLQAPILNWNPLKNREADGLIAPHIEIKSRYSSSNLEVPQLTFSALENKRGSFALSLNKQLEPPSIELMKPRKSEARLSLKTIEILGDNLPRYARNQTVMEYMKFPLRNPTNYERTSVCENLLSNSGVMSFPKGEPISLHQSLMFENLNKATNRLPLMPPVMLTAYSKSMIISEMRNQNTRSQKEHAEDQTANQEPSQMNGNNSLMMFVNLANLAPKCKSNASNSSRTSEIYVKLPPVAVSDGRKMRTLFWDKIEPNQLVSSIWIQVYNNYVGVILNKLLDFFEDKSRETKGSFKIELVYEESKRKSIAFAIAKLFKLANFTWDRLAKALWEVDAREIGLEAMLSFRKMIPTQAEIEAISELQQADLPRLDGPSMWLVVAASVPRLLHRLNFLELEHRIEQEMKKNTEYVRDFLAVCEFLQDNKDFQKFLRLCIDAGNVLNTEKAQGAALGFKISSLAQFCACKSVVRNGLSLMEYILFECCIQDPNCLSFITQISPKLITISLRNLEDVVEDLISFKKQFFTLKVQLEEAEHNSKSKDLQFVKRFQKFFLANAEHIVLLEEEAIRLKEFYLETMIFLGETEKGIVSKKSKEVISGVAGAFVEMQSIVSKFKK